jgi:decaprenylphospho-beta-D-ribofuranose 2-oxidase
VSTLPDARPLPTLLTGWGRTAPTASRVVPARDDADVKGALAAPPPRGVIARGLGRSYGDAAQNAGGVVLDMTGAAAPVVVEPSGLVTATGGTSLDAVMRELLPRGWFVPVTPGTRHVTVGGAVAADVHGKNHHVDGSWMNHVVALTLALPGGETRVVSPAQDADVFWATAGGMGLTGVVTSCTFRAIPVETSQMLVDATRLPDLDAVLAAMTDSDRRSRYTVAWLDVLARGRSLGRSVLTTADHAPLAAVSGSEPSDASVAAAARAFDPHARFGAPLLVPGPVLNRFSIRAFNELWFRKAPASRRDELQSITTYFHPLDLVRDWNRLYGRGGFVQWQFVVPDAATDTLRAVIERLGGAGAASFLTVLKHFGPANPAPLSFPAPGWTLALDIPAAAPGLAVVLDELDRLVVEAGGRVYLAKDSRVDPSLLAAMYPRLDEWRAVQARLDPAGELRSDLARRLGLVPLAPLVTTPVKPAAKPAVKP